MRAIVFMVFMALVSLGPAQARSGEIQDVITSQIEAFKLDEFQTAFTFAHPNIQGIFRTPENFGRMVTQGYPMVWRPAEVEYLDQRVEQGQTLQNVQIVDAEGRVFVLEYTMRQTPDGWKIAGVRILEKSGLSA